MNNLIGGNNKAFSGFERIMMLMICILIIWMPIPLGCNRIWSLAILEFCILLLGVVHIGYCIKH
jgi:hypothetical protein